MLIIIMFYDSLWLIKYIYKKNGCERPHLCELDIYIWNILISELILHI